MKIYFCGSIRGGRDDVALYRKIVHRLRGHGTVLTEHVSSAELSDRDHRPLTWTPDVDHRPLTWTCSDLLRPAQTCRPCVTAVLWTGEGAALAGDKFIHDRDVEWLRQSDVVVAEVTQPSLGVGYELGRAVDMNKRILCLFRPSSGRCLSAMVRGADDGGLFVVRDYSEDEVENVLDQFFSSLKK